MPRFPKPWFRKDRSCWFVQLDGKQHNLGPDRELAFKRYHDLMARPRKRKVPSETVPAVIDLFLDWCDKNRAQRTYEWYQVRCQAFVDTIPPELRVADLRPHHLQTWVDAHAAWAPGNKRNACRAIPRTMNWAVKQGSIEHSPMENLDRARGGGIASRPVFSAFQNQLDVCSQICEHYRGGKKDAPDPRRVLSGR